MAPSPAPSGDENPVYGRVFALAVPAAVGVPGLLAVLGEAVELVVPGDVEVPTEVLAVDAVEVLELDVPEVPDPVLAAGGGGAGAVERGAVLCLLVLELDELLQPASGSMYC